MKNKNEIVFIIDDEESVRRSISLLLKSSGYCVEVFSSSEEFINKDKFDGVGCIILDVNLGGKSGLDLQEELLQESFQFPIIFITGKGSIPMSVEAMKKGAINFLPKPFEDQALLQSVEEALILCRKNKSEIEEIKSINSLISKLSEREMEVFRYVISGMLNKQIAAELNIAEHTVKLHRGKITEKLGVKSVAEMVRFAEKAGIQPPQ
ncbi:MAG: response regulator [Ignavibacteriaceae bacterium]